MEEQGGFARYIHWDDVYEEMSCDFYGRTHADGFSLRFYDANISNIGSFPNAFLVLEVIGGVGTYRKCRSIPQHPLA